MPAGRPLKFQTVDELETLIEGYFTHCDMEKEPYTITGLALWLDTSRETLLDYQGREEYSDTIKRAKLKCENWVEKGMLGNKVNPTAGIFNLKNNYGWRDKTEQDVTSGGKPIVIDHELLIKNATNTSTETNSEGQA